MYTSENHKLKRNAAYWLITGYIQKILIEYNLRKQRSKSHVAIICIPVSEMNLLGSVSASQLETCFTQSCNDQIRFWYSLKWNWFHYESALQSESNWWVGLKFRRLIRNNIIQIRPVFGDSELGKLKIFSRSTFILSISSNLLQWTILIWPIYLYMYRFYLKI